MTIFELYSLNICVNHKRFIKIWIYDIFNKHNVLYDYQFEFHTLYSIHIASITLTDKLLTHWGRATYIFIGTNTNIGSDNGLSPGRRQAIIWTNARLLLIEPLGTNFSEILIKIHTFSFKKMHLKMSGKWRPFCLGLNVLHALDDGSKVVKMFPDFSQAFDRHNWSWYFAT